MTEGHLIQVDDWTFRVSHPGGEGLFPVFILIHGWTGDENSMWIFTSRLPRQAVYIAPRGIFRSNRGGYSWLPNHADALPPIEEFSQVVVRLRSFLTQANFPWADFSNMYLIGFSQGVAFALSYLLKFPKEVEALAGLSGFMPGGARRLVFPGMLSGKRIFIAHGSKDGMVPVAQAREAVEILEIGGAAVTYCEDEVEHKLSASCFRGLEAFFQGTSQC